MSETIDHGRDAGPDATVEARTSSGGVAVRKVASIHETGAAVVHLTIRSERLVRSRIRLVDPIPPPLAGQPIEFHPHYDPVNWRAEDGAAVYETTLLPDDERTTAYGVVLDDPGQIVLFDGEPTVEVEALDDGTLGPTANGSGEEGPAEAAPSATDGAGAGDAPAGPDGADAPDDAGFSFGDGASSPSEAAATDGSGAPATDGASAGGAGAGGSGRNAILEALGESTGSEPSGGRGLPSGPDPLGDDADAFRYVADQHVELSRDVERLEARVIALADALEERQAALEETVEELERAVRRETAWREELRRTLSGDAGER